MTLNIPLFRSERQVIFLGLYCNALIIICALVIWKFGKVIVRNSHERCSMKKSVFKIFFQFTGKHLSQSLFFNKVAGLRFPTLFKETLAQTFSCKFCKIFQSGFFYRTSGRLLLNIVTVQFCCWHQNNLYFSYSDSFLICNFLMFYCRIPWFCPYWISFYFW